MNATVIGESLVDVVETADGTREHPGGSPLNVAIGLARLSHGVCLITRVGTDARGRRLRDHLAAAGVRLLPGALDALPTSTTRATLDAQGRATYGFELVWELPAVRLPAATDLVHTGSIAAFVAPGRDRVAALVGEARGTATVSFDPNIRPALIGDPGPARERAQRLIQDCDVVKASDEDVAWLVPGQDPVAVAAGWLDLGPALVVLTRGAAGAVGMCRAGTVTVEAPRLPVVDTIGAGDAFMAGLLDGLARGALVGAARRADLHGIDLPTLSTVVQRAVYAGTLTCTRAGADPPRLEELKRTVPAR